MAGSQTEHQYSSEVYGTNFWNSYAHTPASKLPDRVREAYDHIIQFIKASKKKRAASARQAVNYFTIAIKNFLEEKGCVAIPDNVARELAPYFSQKQLVGKKDYDLIAHQVDVLMAACAAVYSPHGDISEANLSNLKFYLQDWFGLEPAGNAVEMFASDFGGGMPNGKWFVISGFRDLYEWIVKDAENKVGSGSISRLKTRRGSDITSIVNTEHTSFERVVTFFDTCLKMKPLIDLIIKYECKPRCEDFMSLGGGALLIDFTLENLMTYLGKLFDLPALFEKLEEAEHNEFLSVLHSVLAKEIENLGMHNTTGTYRDGLRMIETLLGPDAKSLDQDELHRICYRKFYKAKCAARDEGKPLLELIFKLLLVRVTQSFYADELGNMKFLAQPPKKDTFWQGVLRTKIKPILAGDTDPLALKIPNSNGPYKRFVTSLQNAFRKIYLPDEMNVNMGLKSSNSEADFVAVSLA